MKRFSDPPEERSQRTLLVHVAQVAAADGVVLVGRPAEPLASFRQILRQAAVAVLVKVTEIVLSASVAKLGSPKVVLRGFVLVNFDTDAYCR